MQSDDARQKSVNARFLQDGVDDSCGNVRKHLNELLATVPDLTSQLPQNLPRGCESVLEEIKSHLGLQTVLIVQLHRSNQPQSTITEARHLNHVTDAIQEVQWRNLWQSLGLLGCLCRRSTRLSRGATSSNLLPKHLKTSVTDPSVAQLTTSRPILTTASRAFEIDPKRPPSPSAPLSVTGP